MMIPILNPISEPIQGDGKHGTHSITNQLPARQRQLRAADPRRFGDKAEELEQFMMELEYRVSLESKKFPNTKTKTWYTAE
jgi:hypothetical protein